MELTNFEACSRDRFIYVGDVCFFYPIWIDPNFNITNLFKLLNHI